MENNFGILKFSDTIVEEETEVVTEILAWLKFMPLSVEFRRIERIYEMKGYSQKFELLEQNIVTPEYIITMQRNEDESLSFELEKL